MLLITKCKSNEERFFYINKAASEFWSLRVLEHHINANLYKNQGKIANNFTTTLPGNIKANALQVFQDEYLFDFISLEEDDERVIEGQLVSNIKNMIMTLGKGFVATYRTSKELPKEMKGILPDEGELAKLL